MTSDIEDKDDVAENADLHSLLREYTLKLQTTCEVESNRYQRAVHRSSQIQLFSFLLVFAAYGLYLYLKPSLTSNPETLAIYTCGLGAFLFLLTWMHFRNHRIVRSISLNYQMRLLASSLEQLVELASQYSEHGSRHLGRRVKEPRARSGTAKAPVWTVSRRIELDIRIAEAEGTLATYKNVVESTRMRLLPYPLSSLEKLFMAENPELPTADYASKSRKTRKIRL